MIGFREMGPSRSYDTFLVKTKQNKTKKSVKSYFLTLLGFCIILQPSSPKKRQEKEIKNGEETTCHT